MAQAKAIWLCWTNNYVRSDDGYVIHAIRDSGNKALCGCKIQEFGVKMDAENEPGCKRCRKILKL